MKVFMMKPSTCEPVTNISSYEIENAQIENAAKTVFSTERNAKVTQVTNKAMIHQL